MIQIEGEEVLVVLLYRPPITDQQQIHHFIDELTYQLGVLQIDQHNTIILGDFNLDQLHHPYIDLFHGICDRFLLTQRANYSTHVFGGILDLVFHNKKQEPVEWTPSPYSDHFVLIVDV